MNLIGQPIAVIGLGYVGLPLAVEPNRGRGAQAGRRRHLRIDRLLRRHRGNLLAGARATQRPEVQHRLLLRLQPRAYQPWRQAHRLTAIKKVTSGSTPEAADAIDALYASIITAGTHKASSIRVAEAAKVIENTQRDRNIALMNELAILFNRLGLDTGDVLQAAGTKWNFLPFRPGLVGGHCIGVDPYYLTHKAQAVGYHPEIILAGRRINDGMGPYVANVLAVAHRQYVDMGVKYITTRQLGTEK
jgi:nucleotide sugar dehydrogenase